MALPSFWQLLLPNIVNNGDVNTLVVVGISIIALLILDAVAFGGFVVNIIGRVLSVVTKGRLNALTLRIALVALSLIMIYTVSIIQDLIATTEGVILVVGVALLLLVILILVINRVVKEQGDDSGDGSKPIRL